MNQSKLAWLHYGAYLWILLCSSAKAAVPQRMTWEVGGVTREALVALPFLADATESPKPLVFVFHGHGGTSRHAATSFSLHTLWPEAVCVYPQGLPTVGRLKDPEGKKSGCKPGPGTMKTLI